MYCIGIDGGGTKTQGLLCNLEGTILANCTVGPSNYQTCSLLTTKNNLEKLLLELLSTSTVTLSEIGIIYFALSGVDTQKDEAILHAMLLELCPSTPFILANDLTALLRLGSETGTGVATIYGTGANVMAIDDTHTTYRLRSLDYPLGGIGGGFEIAQDALHFTFRADEGTCQMTKLLDQVPSTLGYNTVEGLLAALYPEDTLTSQQYNLLPPLVFKLASEGDLTSQVILKKFAETHASLIIGILNKCTFKSTIPVILGGSVFKGDSRFFLDIIKQMLHEHNFNLSYIHPHLPPVYGSLLCALERLTPLTPCHYSNLGLQ